MARAPHLQAEPHVQPCGHGPALPSPQRRLAVLGLLAGAVLPGRAATSLAAPTGPVILVVSGQVRQPNMGPDAAFDMAMLASLPQHSFTTRTPWFPDANKFSGPLLRDVLAAAGAQGDTLRAIALNDYRVDLPFDDAQRHDVMLARLLDDKPMLVRDKGPLFIIYPFDSNAALRNAVYYSRCAWQLKRIEVQ